LIVGPLLTALGFALFVLPEIGGRYWTTFFPAVVVLGLGMAVTVAPLTTAVMSSVSERNAGVASGVNNAVSRAAGLLAIAIMGVFALNAFNRSLDRRLETVDLNPQAMAELNAERSKLAGAQAPDALSEETRERVQRAIDLAFISSFRLVMLIAAGLTLVSAGMAAVTIKDDKNGRAMEAQPDLSLGQ
jgi:hypothetical protein